MSTNTGNMTGTNTTTTGTVGNNTGTTKPATGPSTGPSTGPATGPSTRPSTRPSTGPSSTATKDYKKMSPADLFKDFISKIGADKVDPTFTTFLGKTFSGYVTNPDYATDYDGSSK